jgi:hypothetical protein
MTTKELINLLQQTDPDGNLKVGINKTFRCDLVSGVQVLSGKDKTTKTKEQFVIIYGIGADGK